MGAQLSSEDPDSGIITVNTRQQPAAGTSQTPDPLLDQLQDIREVLPVLLSEKDFNWNDIKSATALTSGNLLSAEAALELLQKVKDWEHRCATDIVERQSTLHGKIGVADQAAAAAVKHVTRSAEEMELLSTQLSAVQSLPQSMEELTRKVQELEQRLQQLTQKARSPRWKAPSQQPSPFSSFKWPTG